MPHIWMTEPDPNAVAVSVSVYDSKGHESNAVPVRLLPMESDLNKAFEERQELEPYEEQGADIARWPDTAVWPRPDNAAQLYYLAAASYPTPDPCTARLMYVIQGGGEPENRVRIHLGRSLTSIRLVQLASQLPGCDWALVYDRTGEYTPETAGVLRRLFGLMSTHARTLAADAHYRSALENCMLNRRLAQHIGDEVYILFCVSHTADVIAMRSVLDILKNMPTDRETLEWLRGQLAAVEGAPFRPEVAFRKWLSQELADWRLYDGDRPFERQWALAQIEEESRKEEEKEPADEQSLIRAARGQWWLPQVEDESQRKEATELTDEELLIGFLLAQRTWRDKQYGLNVPDALLARAREELGGVIHRAVRIMVSSLPYDQRQSELQGLEEELFSRTRHHEPIALLRYAPTNFTAYDRLATNNAAFLNCARVAVEVLLVQARTGQLPAELPEGLPKDPYSGEDFGYERTEEGFVLRFDPGGISGIRRPLREHEFTVSDR